MVYLRYEYNPTFIKKDISEQISEALRDYWNTSRLLEYFVYIASKNSCEGYINDYLEFFYIALH